MADVTRCHPDYDRVHGAWERVRDAIAGEDAVKSRGSQYLPVPTGMERGNLHRKYESLDAWGEGEEYAAYKKRAMFYAAAGRTVRAMVGMMLRKPAEVEAPGRVEAALERIMPDGQPFEALAQSVCEELAGVSRVGLFVDAPETATPNPQPYVTVYCAEDIMNWKCAVDPETGRERPVLVVLRETMDEIEDGDVFGGETCEVRRVLRLGNPFDPLNLSAEEEESGELPDDPDQEDLAGWYGLSPSEIGVPLYSQEIWREVKREEGEGNGDREWRLERRIFPRRQGGMLWGEIPFLIANGTDLRWTTQAPVVGDLVSTNLAHYRNSADLEHGLHLTALPTPYAVGFQFEERDQLVFGGSAAWVTDNPEAKVGMIEFTGAGLAAIRDEMDRKERLMAVLGSRLLEADKAGVEAAETVKLRQAGEQSALSAISRTASLLLEGGLKFLAAWVLEDPGSVMVRLNDDFSSAQMSDRQMVALTQMLQAGVISFDTYFHQLQQGEIYPEGRTLDDERSLIEEGLPPALAQALAAPEAEDDSEGEDEAEGGDESEEGSP
jgi:hypothetical protein